MVWKRTHDGADLDEDLHSLREDPYDLHPVMVTVTEDYLIALECKALRESMTLYASRELTDGYIAPAVLPMIAANAQIRPDRVPKVIARLASPKGRVSGRALTPARTKRQGGGWEVRNFLKYNFSKDVVERRRAAEKRLAWLQDTAPGRKIRDMIQARDQFRCRYCYIEMKPGDQRSSLRPTYDHARPHDPDLARDPRWIVQACQFHNGMKLDRTPEEAGLELLPPWCESSEAIRSKAQRIQDVAMVVAARLADKDPTPEEVAAMVTQVLSTWSEHPPMTPDSTAIQRPFDGDRTTGSGRVGSVRDGEAHPTPSVGPFDDPPDPSEQTTASGNAGSSAGRREN